MFGIVFRPVLYLTLFTTVMCVPATTVDGFLPAVPTLKERNNN